MSASLETFAAALVLERARARLPRVAAARAAARTFGVAIAGLSRVARSVGVDSRPAPTSEWGPRFLKRDPSTHCGSRRRVLRRGISGGAGARPRRSQCRRGPVRLGLRAVRRRLARAARCARRGKPRADPATRCAPGSPPGCAASRPRSAWCPAAAWPPRRAGCCPPFGSGTDTPARACRLILVHEMWHARRRDPVRLALIAAVRRVYWWNPIVAHLARQAVLMIESSVTTVAPRCSANRVTSQSSRR